MVIKDVKEEGRWGSREREESGKCTFFFFIVGAHARAIVFTYHISNLFYPMEIEHPSM